MVLGFIHYSKIVFSSFCGYLPKFENIAYAYFILAPLGTRTRTLLRSILLINDNMIYEIVYSHQTVIWRAINTVPKDDRKTRHLGIQQAKL